MLAKAINQGVFSSMTKLSLCTCELTAAGGYVIAKAVAGLPKFQSLRIDGNAISERGVEEMQKVLLRSGKQLEEMEDNDEEGEDDLEDELVEEEPLVEGADMEDVTDALKAAKI